MDVITHTSDRIRDAVAAVTADTSLAVSLAAMALLLGATAGTFPDLGDGVGSAQVVAMWFVIGRKAALEHVPEGATRH